MHPESCHFEKGKKCKRGEQPSSCNCLTVIFPLLTISFPDIYVNAMSVWNLYFIIKLHHNAFEMMCEPMRENCTYKGQVSTPKVAVSVNFFPFNPRMCLFGAHGCVSIFLLVRQWDNSPSGIYREERAIYHFRFGIIKLCECVCVWGGTLKSH